MKIKGLLGYWGCRVIRLSLAFFYLLSLTFPLCLYAGEYNPKQSLPSSPMAKDQTREPLLPLVLLATVLGRNPQDSLAVIRDMALKRQVVYKIGETISGYQLTDIKRGRVTLLKNGRLSFLDFPRGGNESNGPIMVISEKERLINKDALSKRFGDINTLLEQGLILPQIQSGKITGLKIMRIKDKQLAELGGIKEADVITKIQGQKLDSLRSALKLYSRLKDEPKIEVEIKRGKETKDLIYYLN